MTRANYQTVRLSAGKHGSPEHGVCVMELSSMLAEEEFGDRPGCVSPVIGGFLRTYNDGIDHQHRQDLYAYAVRIIGTGGRRSIEGQRVTMCLEWGHRELAPLTLRFPLWASPSGSTAGFEAAGAYAARAALEGGAGMHAEALAFLERLIDAGREPPDGSIPRRSRPRRSSIGWRFLERWSERGRAAV